MYILCLSDKTRAGTKIEIVSERKNCEIAHVSPSNGLCNHCGTNQTVLIQIYNALQYIIFQRMFEITENSASNLLLSVDPDVHAVKVTFEDLQQLNRH